MQRILLLLSMLVILLTYGCGENDSTTAPYSSTLTINPEAMSFNIISSAPLTSVEDYVNITVLDEKGLPAPNQELFFRTGSYTTLRDASHNIIDTSVGSVHGVTGDSGNYFLWVEFLAGASLKYTTNVRITSGTNDVWMEISVDNKGS